MIKEENMIPFVKMNHYITDRIHKPISIFKKNLNKKPGVRLL